MHQENKRKYEMRVATVDGLVTLFYDGSKMLYNEELDLEWHRAYNHERSAGRDGSGAARILSNECKEYIKERWTWQQIIVVEGVTEISEHTFESCYSISRVIFADTVVRIEKRAFLYCKNLYHIKLSINLELIGEEAFEYCNLFSVFVPPTCTEIGRSAFECNENLFILNVPQHTELGRGIINDTRLMKILGYSYWMQNIINPPEVNEKIKSVNDGDEYHLHRVCSSFQPRKQVIGAIIDENGIGAFQERNGIGITASHYLAKNPYKDITELDIIRDYIMKKMGESI